MGFKKMWTFEIFKADLGYIYIQFQMKDAI